MGPWETQDARKLYLDEIDKQDETIALVVHKNAIGSEVCLACSAKLYNDLKLYRWGATKLGVITFTKWMQVFNFTTLNCRCDI